MAPQEVPDRDTHATQGQTDRQAGSQTVSQSVKQAGYATLVDAQQHMAQLTIARTLAMQRPLPSKATSSQASEGMLLHCAVLCGAEAAPCRTRPGQHAVNSHMQMSR